MKIDIKLVKERENSWEVFEVGGCYAGKVEKDSYDIWFEAEVDYNMNTDFLDALSKAMKELK